jgi:hypothetical protein
MTTKSYHSLPGDPKGYVEKALEMGISFRRGPTWGNWWRAHLPETLRVYEGALGMGCLSLRGSVGGGLGGAPSLGTLEDRFFERYARYPVGEPPSNRGLVGEPGGGSFAWAFERKERISGFLFWTRRSLTF